MLIGHQMSSKSKKCPILQNYFALFHYSFEAKLSVSSIGVTNIGVSMVNSWSTTLCRPTKFDWKAVSIGTLYIPVLRTWYGNYLRKVMDVHRRLQGQETWNALIPLSSVSSEMIFWWGFCLCSSKKGIFCSPSTISHREGRAKHQENTKEWRHCIKTF